MTLSPRGDWRMPSDACAALWLAELEELQIKDGAARFVDSPCPDHICEGFGWLSNEDQTATCLPARAVLTIVPVS